MNLISNKVNALWFALFFLIANQAVAQTVFENDINGSDPSSTNPFSQGQITSDGLSSSGIAFGPGLINANATGRFNTEGYSSSGTLSLANNDYISWTLVPGTCYEVDLSALVIAFQRNGQGPQNIALRSSLDNYSTNIWILTGISPGETTSSISLSNAQFQNLTSEVTFRLYGWNAGLSNGAFSINSFKFTGNVNSLNQAIAGIISGPSEICANSDFELLLSGQTGNIQWQVSNDNNSFSDISGAISSTYAATNASNTAYYRAALTVGICPAVFTNSHLVVVNPIPEVIVSNVVACDSYLWSKNGITYTSSGSYTFISGCQTELLQLTVNTSIPYFVDIDGDGFGSTTTSNFCSMPTIGYSVNSSDCDDAVASTFPGAIESCNGIDDNCSGFIDEGCPSTIPGEEPFNSFSAPNGMYSYCSSFYGSLAGAFPSSSALSSCVTGEDVWYNFIAQTSGVTIFIGSYVNDIVIELQDANGNLIEIENTVLGPGTEVLTTAGLIQGGLYRFAVRNNNSILNPGGPFSACVRHLKRGGADSGTSATWPGILSTCSLFKATYCGGTGVQYRFTWTGITGTAIGQVFTRTQTSDYLNVTAVTPSLPAGCSYNVLVTAIYSIPNGAGVNEVVELPALSPTTITISPVANVVLRSSDQLSNGPRYRGSVVAALPWVCGVTNWRWRFTEVNPLTLQTVGLPIEQNRAAASNYINLNSVTALQYGKTYAVQSAPIFSYTGTNYQWGPVAYMAIIGTAGMVVDASQDAMQGPSEDSTKDVSQDASQEFELAVFPNPSNGSDLNLNISGLASDNVQVKIYDSMGRKIQSERYVVDGTLQTTLEFEKELSNGLYLIEVTAGTSTKSVRLLIQK